MNNNYTDLELNRVFSLISMNDEAFERHYGINEEFARKTEASQSTLNEESLSLPEADYPLHD